MGYEALMATVGWVLGAVCGSEQSATQKLLQRWREEVKAGSRSFYNPPQAYFHYQAPIGWGEI